MISVSKYPRGYVSAQVSSQRFVGDSYGDSVITELYRAVLDRRQITNDWSFIDNVIKATIRLIGTDFNKWTFLQVPNNPYIYGVNRDFLEDTINYIATGHRKMPIALWAELLIESPREKARIDKIDTTKAVSYLENGNAYISAWLRHSDGLMDLIMTMNILFGYTGESINKEAEELKRSKK